jgi:chromosome partitioning protein
VLVPCRPKAFDLAAIEATADLVRSFRKPAFAVLMAGPPHGALIHREATEVISQSFGLALAPVHLPERAAFHHGAAEGKTAEAFAPGSKAAGEVGALWAWTREQLGVSTYELLEAAGL